MDAISIARGGMAAAERRFEAAASRVVQAPSDDGVDLAREMVELVEAKQHFSANLKVVRFADEMWTSLLEIQVR
ncbi:flagellar basal body rod C-terminal domain-containing protein [Phenylobacterium sp. VNQ135]|uniref:flagellar basal body rod C-terminal domain-containing protein n=1 Tax=Phenylobacterium sp. VNQ135 TaxID=3400922 RepID=UPI003C01C6D0